ncbi:MAG: hypothetical protein ACYSWX_08135 [Planctomycetota bacterium]
MSNFLRTNWAWIAVPFVLTLLSIGAFIWFSQPAETGDNPFGYNVF